MNRLAARRRRASEEVVYQLWRLEQIRPKWSDWWTPEMEARWQESIKVAPRHAHHDRALLDEAVRIRMSLARIADNLESLGYAVNAHDHSTSRHLVEQSSHLPLP